MRLCLCWWGWRGGGGGVGVSLGEVKACPIDIIRSSLGHKSQSTIQTSNPSPSPTSLDTPAKAADYQWHGHLSLRHPALARCKLGIKRQRHEKDLGRLGRSENYITFVVE